MGNVMRAVHKFLENVEKGKFKMEELRDQIECDFHPYSSNTVTRHLLQKYGENTLITTSIQCFKFSGFKSV